MDTKLYDTNLYYVLLADGWHIVSDVNHTQCDLMFVVAEQTTTPPPSVHITCMNVVLNTNPSALFNSLYPDRQMTGVPNEH